jgi:hypothetical protein
MTSHKKPIGPIETAETYAIVAAALVRLLSERPGKSIAFTKKEYEERTLKVLNISITKIGTDEVAVISLDEKANVDEFVPGVIYGMGKNNND